MVSNLAVVDEEWISRPHLRIYSLVVEPLVNCGHPSHVNLYGNGEIEEVNELVAIASRAFRRTVSNHKLSLS